METNPLRVLDCKVPDCRAATESAPELIDHLSPEARTHFDQVLAGLAAIGIPYRLNPRLVRGLDYYCLTSFEITSTHLGAQNAVGAGGRYDGLVETLGGPSVPAVGFALGLERVSLMLPEASRPRHMSVFIMWRRSERKGPSWGSCFSTNSVESEFQPIVTIAPPHSRLTFAKPTDRSVVSLFFWAMMRQLVALSFSATLSRRLKRNSLWPVSPLSLKLVHSPHKEGQFLMLTLC